jgi:hypothetical protein
LQAPRSRGPGSRRCGVGPAGRGRSRPLRGEPGGRTPPITCSVESTSRSATRSRATSYNAASLLSRCRRCCTVCGPAGPPPRWCRGAYVKKYYPAAFCAGLLRAQPMGFYSPQSLVADAHRHGVIIHGPDINASRTHATLEPTPTAPTASPTGSSPAGSARTVPRHRGPRAPGVDAVARARGACQCRGVHRSRHRSAPRAVAAGAAAQTRPEHLPGAAIGSPP